MDDNSNEIKRLLKKSLSNWYWFALCFALALAAAWFLYVQEQTIYQVRSSIVVNEEKQSGSQLPEETIITGLPFNSRGSLNRQMEIIRSRYLMEKVVDSLGLAISYHAEDKYKTRELYRSSPIHVHAVDDLLKIYENTIRVLQIDENRFKLIPEEGDTLVYNFGTPFQVGEASVVLEKDSLIPMDARVIAITFHDPVILATYYSSQLVLKKIAQSNVLSITIEDPAPNKMVDIIFQLIDAYNLDAQMEKNRLAGKSLDFIDERLSSVARELKQEESKQASIRSSSQVTSGIGESAQRYFDKLSTVDASRSQLGGAKVTLEEIKSFVSDPTKRDELIPNFGDMGVISFTPQITQYNTLIARRARLLTTATQQHPDVKKANGEITEFRRNIQNAVDIAIRDLNSKEQKLVAEINPVQAKVKALPFVGRQLKDIERTADVRGEVFSYLLKKREETAIGLAANVENIRMLDVPIAKRTPVGPSKKQFFIFAVLFGFGLPAGVLFGMDKLNTKIRDKDDVKAIIGDIPFLGELAKVKSAKSKLVTNANQTALSEMFRLIRTNLQFLSAGKEQKTILVTSYISGDGKTFVSGNLAATLALTSKKTIVLELDLRRPKLTELIFDTPPDAGVTNYLLGHKKVDEIIRKVDEVDNLYMMSSGPTPPNPAELLMSDKLSELIKELKERFDYIVFDTPPVSLVTDAYLLSKHADNCILVVHAAKTKKQELQYLAEVCKEGKLVRPALVLNGTKTPKRYGYYY